MPGDKSNKRKAAEQPKDAEAEIEEEEFDQGAFDEAVASEAKRLEQLFGPLEKSEEVAIAFEYRMALGNSYQDDVKRDAWAAYVGADGTDIETIKLWEIAIYRKTKQPVRFFLRGQKKLDPDTVDILGTTIDYWIWFERERKLSEKHQVIASQVEAGGGRWRLQGRHVSRDDEAFQRRNGDSEWDKEGLNLLRLGVCQVDSSPSAKRLKKEHSRTTRASDRRRSSNDAASATSSSATLDRHGNEASRAPRGHNGPSTSNAGRVFHPNFIDEEDEDIAGPSTASVPSRPAPRAPCVSDSPTPTVPQILLTPREKVQRMKNHARTLTQTISKWEEAEKSVNVDRDFVKATGVNLKEKSMIF